MDNRTEISMRAKPEENRVFSFKGWLIAINVGIILAIIGFVMSSNWAKFALMNDVGFALLWSGIAILVFGTFGVFFTLIRIRLEYRQSKFLSTSYWEMAVVTLPVVGSMTSDSWAATTLANNVEFAQLWIGIVIILLGITGAIIGLAKIRSDLKKKDSLPNELEKPEVLKVKKNAASSKSALDKKRLLTGNVKLDELLFGGIPQNFAVALLMPPSDEGDSIIKGFIETGVKNSQPTFYLTIDPSFARDLARKYPTTLSLFFTKPQLDYMTKKQPNMFYLKGVENLTEITITIVKELRKLDPTKTTPRRICMNIVSEVLLLHGHIVTRRWLSELVETLKTKNFTILAVMNPLMHSSKEVQALLGLFEGEINIREKETVRELKRFLKITRMSNQKYLKSEIVLTEE